MLLHSCYVSWYVLLWDQMGPKGGCDGSVLVFIISHECLSSFFCHVSQASHVMFPNFSSVIHVSVLFHGNSSLKCREVQFKP